MAFHAVPHVISKDPKRRLIKAIMMTSPREDVSPSKWLLMNGPASSSRRFETSPAKIGIKVIALKIRAIVTIS